METRFYPSPRERSEWWGGIGRLRRPFFNNAEAELRLWRVKRASGWGVLEQALHPGLRFGLPAPRLPLRALFGKVLGRARRGVFSAAFGQFGLS
jgi:hypothetical protein